MLNPPMHYSQNAVAITQQFEDCYLTAYPDPASPLARALQSAGLWNAVLHGMTIPDSYSNLSGAPWTIGWGRTGADVVQGLTSTQDIEDAWLISIYDQNETRLNQDLSCDVTQGEFDALMDMYYNLGANAVEHSTLMKLLNEGDAAGASAQIPLWDKAVGQVVQGLLRRRVADQSLFNS